MGCICGKCLNGARGIVNHRVALLIRHQRVGPAVGEYAVVDKGAIGCCHFTNRYPVCELAERHGCISAVIRNKARHTQLLDQVVIAGFRGQLVNDLCRNRIERILQGFKNRHQAVVFTAVILREPACSAQCNIGFVPDPRVWGDITKLCCRAIGGNRLKGRSGRPLRAGGTVEGEVPVLLSYAAGKRNNCPVVRIHHDNAALELLRSRRFGNLIEIFINIVNSRLNIRVEAAIDLVAAVEHKRPRGVPADPFQLCQIGDHVLNDRLFIPGVDLLDGVFLRGPGKVKRLCGSLFEFLISDVTLVIHLSQNRLLPALVVLLVVERVIIGRQVGDAGNGGTLREA